MSDSKACKKCKDTGWVKVPGGLDMLCLHTVDPKDVVTDAEIEELATIHSRQTIDLPAGKNLAAYILERYAYLGPRVARELQRLRKQGKKGTAPLPQGDEL